MTLEDGFLSATLKSLRDGIVVTDVSSPKNEIIYANPAFCRMVGYTEAELAGMGTRFLLGKKTRPTAAHNFRRAINEKIPCLVTVSANKKDGSEIWLEISGSPVNENGDELRHYVGICRDVTARIEALEALVASDTVIEKSIDNSHVPSIDPLTSLYNRPYFDEYAEREWGAMLTQHLPMSIFMVKIRGMENLPEVGDNQLSRSNLLNLLADSLRQTFRRGTDLVARFDQQKFVTVCAGLGWEEAEKVSLNLVERINKVLHEMNEPALALKCFVGLVSAIPEKQHQLDEVVAAANSALAAALEQDASGVHVGEAYLPEEIK